MASNTDNSNKTMVALQKKEQYMPGAQVEKPRLVGCNYYLYGQNGITVVHLKKGVLTLGSTNITLLNNSLQRNIAEILSKEMISASNNRKSRATNIVFVQYHDKFYLVNFNQENKIDKMKEITPFMDCGNELGNLKESTLKLCISSKLNPKQLPLGKLYMYLPKSTSSQVSPNKQSVPTKSVQKTDSIVTYEFRYDDEKIHVYFLDKFEDFNKIDIINPPN
jgi:hypothetical protein